MKITWSVLLVGLEKDWLDVFDVIDILNEYWTHLIDESDLLLELYTSEYDKELFINLLKNKVRIEREEAIEYWQHNALLNIKQSNKSTKQKLEDIASEWVRFDYPEDWRVFIYYMPSDKSNSVKSIYQIFLNYLKKKIIDRE